MKTFITATLLTLASTLAAAQASPVGLWKTIDDETKQEKSTVQITEADPSVSAELNFLTTALRVDIRCTPSARTTDNTAGRPSGTAATASETPSSRIVTQSPGVRGVCTIAMVSMMTIAIAMTTRPSIAPTRLISAWRGVSSSSV